MRDIQSEAIARLVVLLSSICQVEEGDARSLLDSDDDGLPDELIVLQPGSTAELVSSAPQGRVQNSLREQVVVNIVLITRKREYAQLLRTNRLAVKVATAGMKCGLDVVQGVQSAGFQPESPLPPGDGQRWAAHVMPLQITYVQPLV